MHIIKARQIIHRLYVEIGNDACKDKRDETLSYKIRQLYDDNDKKKCAEFILLLNFYDFLETIAYFANKYHVEASELDDLLGGSIEYFHKIFIPLRDHLRYHYGDDPSTPRYYSELDKLVKTIADKKIRKYCTKNNQKTA